MQLLPLSKYYDLIDGAEVLVSENLDGQECPKVLRLKDHSILKLFRLKRYLTSARLIPYAVRFQRHVERLQRADIPTVNIRAVFRIAGLGRTAVHYRPLEGRTLREYCGTHPLDHSQASRLGQFLENLHRRGIYFRSIHFGNMVLTADRRIGLIDVADMRFRRGALGLGLRIRNLRHLFRYEVDIDSLAPVRQVFMDAYCASAALPARQGARWRRHCEAYFQARRLRLEKIL
jgi:tRNA A-37 threonylcarbamoyl transferase component Bud32